VQRNSHYPLIEESEKTIWEKICISPDITQHSNVIINSTILNDNIAEDDELSEDNETGLEIIDQY
ncbi:17158_t:CDS:1, partial [Cetraspora pellucida]